MEKEYLIREKPLKALLFFAFPMIIGNLFCSFTPWWTLLWWEGLWGRMPWRQWEPLTL